MSDWSIVHCRYVRFVRGPALANWVYTCAMLQADAKDILVSALKAADPRTGINKAVSLHAAFHTLKKLLSLLAVLPMVPWWQVSLSADGAVLSVSGRTFAMNNFDEVCLHIVSRHPYSASQVFIMCRGS